MDLDISTVLREWELSDSVPKDIIRLRIRDVLRVHLNCKVTLMDIDLIFKNGSQSEQIFSI